VTTKESNSTGMPFASRDMLCFSHDWTGDPLSKTHVMRILSREGRVLWINSIGYRTPSVSRADAGRLLKKLSQVVTERLTEVEPNLFVLNPIAIPLFGVAWVQKLNEWLLCQQVKHAMRRLEFKNPINWIFNPAASIVAGKLNEDSLIYYCVDEYSAINGVDAKRFRELERNLLERADLVLVSAENLRQSKLSIRPSIHLIRHGVDYKHFSSALDDSTSVAEELRGLPSPIIGYFGLMSDDWVDPDLLEALAERFTEGSIVLIGKVAMDLSSIADKPNVHILGRKSYASLPTYCKGFDVAFIPFPITELTINANPLKAREYLASGLPVISSAIPEVEVLGSCGIAHSPREFCDAIERAYQSPSNRQELSRTMEDESWEARVQHISELFAASIDTQEQHSSDVKVH
jgi:glycosyltransferase involved in cell wall biosynthesis